MADPEITPPVSDSISDKFLRAAEVNDEEKDNNEVTRSTSSSQTCLDDETPIIYHYLTYETQLPSPVVNSSGSNNASPPPAQPDLKKYMNPFLWSKRRKQFTIWLSCIATLITAYTAGSYSPPVEAMSQEWGVSHVAILVGITTFCIGFAAAPMVLAPFSEINGRYPVFVVAGILYEISQICCAVTRSYPGMLLARFFAGVGSSVFSTMVGGVVSDLYHADERNTPMALFSGGALFGTGIGPLVSGVVTQHLDWRWVFWVQSITCGILIVTVAIFFNETRGSILLSRKAAKLNEWYEAREVAGHVGVHMVSAHDEKDEIQRIRWKVKSDEERESLQKMIAVSVYRPLHLLITEPVVFFFSLWISFAWAVLYLTFGAISLVFEVSHGFSIEQAYAVFASMSIAAVIATCYSIFQEKYTDRLFLPIFTRILGPIDPKKNPERRLYFACVQSLLLPVGLFWFGWTQFPSIPWIVPTLAVGAATMGIYSIYLATFNYLADSYHRYASSALAAQSFCRNLLGGIFPLVTVQLFTNLTFQGAASLLGGLAALLSIVPWVLVFYGPKIRARSKFASVR